MGWQYCILAGENPLNMANVVIISELHYDLHRSHLVEVPLPDDEQLPATTPEGRSINRSAVQLAKHIEKGIREFFSNSTSTTGPGNPQVDIIHVHNATLAKNSDLLPALHILQVQGNHLFLQLHDFAEDGRPNVYSSTDYPVDAHYGCINNRDKKYLSLTGLPDKRLHSIPNLVSPLPGAIPPETDSPDSSPKPKRKSPLEKNERFALYPVRGIRRKNIGELILLSALLENITFGITLKPNNIADLPSYSFWNDLASEIEAPVEFNVAEKMGFETALARADFFISTSVQEGFGFTFLEPWTLKKSVAGRLIPYVNSDFVDAGMKMECFYTSIPIPVDEIDMDSFRQRWLTESKNRITRFSIALRNQGLDAAAKNIRNNIHSLEDHFAELYGSCSRVDFARLDRENQANVIRRVISKPQLAETVRNSVPEFLLCPFASCSSEDQKIVEHNYQQVYTTYGEAQYKQRLKSIYEAAMKEPGESTNIRHLNKEVLLQSFLDSAHIFLITSS